MTIMRVNETHFDHQENLTLVSYVRKRGNSDTLLRVSLFHNDVQLCYMYHRGTWWAIGGRRFHLHKLGKLIKSWVHIMIPFWNCIDPLYHYFTTMFNYQIVPHSSCAR